MCVPKTRGKVPTSFRGYHKKPYRIRLSKFAGALGRYRNLFKVKLCIKKETSPTLRVLSL